MPIHVLYIVSNINKALAFEWIADSLNKDKFTVSFILMNPGDSELESYLRKKNIPFKRINYHGKKHIPRAVFQIFLYLKKLKPQVVHTQLFDASIAGLIASRLSGIKKIIYTRHHSTYHHAYHPRAVKWDKLCNRLSTHIVSISDTVTQILVNKENVLPEKITKIWHGFDIEAFRLPNPQDVARLNLKYNPRNQHPVIGVISRFTEWKGVHHIVPAFKKFLEKEPNALLLLFNASGDYEREINACLKELPLNAYKKILFENEITSLYHVFDMFVHIPIDNHSEAFGQTYIECMASGVPLIATLSGIGNEILVDEVNCLAVDYKDPDAVYTAMLKLNNDPLLKKVITANAQLTAKKNFTLQDMIEKLEFLYLR